ncbi:MAG: formimidoylglutamase [Proteobacteria bacterium]|nr:MAG: formimidoylglutamase [Pseudomonadota bacterium]
MGPTQNKTNSPWRETELDLFFSKQDPDDPRLGEIAKPASLTILSEAIAGAKNLAHFVIAGYPDDEGIRLNGGRPGASEAPKTIRRSLYKMTPALNEDSDFAIWDIGNVDPAKLSLADRHDLGSSAVEAALEAGANWIGLGGGHDYGFAEANGFLNWAKSKASAQSSASRPLVINFDAHFDVRPTTKGLSSGTPFFRMLEAHPEVDFCEIGIQAQCNSKKHMSWLKERGARVLTAEELEASGQPMVTAALALLDDWLLKPRPTFISVDIDAFSSAVAPGCSQSWANGFMPDQFFPLFDLLLKRCDVRALGIYEVSPPLDQDDRTSKLAALIAHRMISRGGRR